MGFSNWLIIYDGSSIHSPSDLVFIGLRALLFSLLLNVGEALKRGTVEAEDIQTALKQMEVIILN